MNLQNARCNNKDKLSHSFTHAERYTTHSATYVAFYIWSPFFVV